MRDTDIIIVTFFFFLSSYTSLLSLLIHFRYPNSCSLDFNWILLAHTMSAENGMSLSERVEVPGISKEAAKKIALLEQEFINAEVEQRMYSSIDLCDMHE